MAVGNRSSVSAAAARIRNSCADEVRADIDALLSREVKPAWLREAKDAMRGVFRSPADRMKMIVEEGAALDAAPADEGLEESIVFAVGTPVFVVKNGAIDIDSAREEAKAWRKILSENAHAVARCLPSVGRLEVENFNGVNDFLGTAWVVDDGIVVTNRHVAALFAETDGAGFKFKTGFDARSPITARIDFLEEFGNAGSDEAPVERIVWIAPESGPDVAFLKLGAPQRSAGRVVLQRATAPPPAKLPVAVIGYPMHDKRARDRKLVEKIFGDVFDKKRLAVGQILGADADRVTHCCSTLGGNSGSPVIDIATGEVVGLHYLGLELIENDAVPISVVERCLARARSILWLPEVSMSNPKETPVSGSVSFTVPLRITVELGAAAAPVAIQPVASVAPDAGEVVPLPSPTKEQVAAAVQKARALFANRQDVVAIKPGYRFENNMITDQRAVVVSVRKKLDEAALVSQGTLSLPKTIDGVRVDVTVASAADLMGSGVGMLEAGTGKKWRTTYVPRPDLPLKRRQAEMDFVIHSGPDCGWPRLEEFLGRTEETLTVAMYEFGAPHIVDGVIDAVKGQDKSLQLVLQLGEHLNDGTKKDDLRDEDTVDLIREKKKRKFKFAPASVGKNGIFDSSYHIKVAVRDKRALWLSSGSWQSSNQPNANPADGEDTQPAALRAYNREWHVILEDKDLAELFQEHIERDYDDAIKAAVPEALAVPEHLAFIPIDAPVEEAPAKPSYFRALVGRRVLDVHPILTPDNYIDVVVPFIRSAKRTIFFQNQSFSTGAIGGEYDRLLDALLAKQRQGLDVRIIFRRFGSKDRETLTDAKDYGFDTDKIRIQHNCHTKGIVIDGDAVLVGSHNWTTAGTGFNRDASLIFYDREIAQFYEQLFLYDWNRIGPARINESIASPIIAETGSRVVPPGFEAVPLSVLLDR